MSFILDALKKLEQKRQQGNVPDLMTEHPALVREEEKRPVWTYVIIAALVANACILLLWARPWEQRQPDINNPIAQTAESTTAPPAAAVVQVKPEQPAPAITKKLPTQQQASNKNTDNNVHNENPVEQDEEISETRETEERLDISGEELQELKDQIKEEHAQIDKLPGPAVMPVENTGQDTESIILEFSQLPSSVRDELPKMAINAHIYSNDPATRITNINGSINHEGDMVTRNIILEEITESGVILNYKGLRFSMRAF